MNALYGLILCIDEHTVMNILEFFLECVTVIISTIFVPEAKSPACSLRDSDTCLNTSSHNKQSENWKLRLH